MYTQICCIFPVKNDSKESQDKIIKMLRYGLERLARDFPWIAGNVIYDETDHLYKIIPTGVIPLIVNELRQETVVPAMSHLRAAGFPCEFLEESLVAPYPTIDRFQAASHPAKVSAPVFAVQANFILGGLILTFIT